MFIDETVDETEQACPHLRLAGDPSTWSPDPSPENRCYRPARVQEEHQAEWCLVEGHIGCSGAPPIATGPHRTGTRLMLGRRRVTRREAEEFVRTVLAAVAVMGLLLVVFTGVVISGRAKVDASAMRIATAEEAGGLVDGEMDAETRGHRDAESADPPLPLGEGQGEGPSVDAGPPADTPPAVGWLSPPYQSAVAPPAAPPADAPDPEPATGEDDTVYTVKRGDTLYSLARAHGLTVDALMEANGLVDPNSIEAGQQLTIPEVTSSP